MLRRKLLHVFTRSMIALVRIMPERLGYAMGGSTAALAWTCIPRWRRTAEVNLRLFYKGEARGADTAEAHRERMKIGRAAAINEGYTGVEFIRLGYLPIERGLAMMVESEGEEYLRGSLAQGKGVIVVAMHYGNWEVVAAKLNSIHQLHAVAKEQRDDFFTKLAVPWRERYGVRNIMVGDKVNSAILRVLQQGDMLGLAADQNGGPTGVFADFAGTSASTAPGPAALGMRTGAPLHMVHSFRLAPGRLRMIVSPRVEIDDIVGYDPATGRYTPEALVACLSRINAQYEAILRHDPTQWLWGQKRWRTRPDGEPYLY